MCPRRATSPGPPREVVGVSAAGRAAATSVSWLCRSGIGASESCCCFSSVLCSLIPTKTSCSSSPLCPPGSFSPWLAVCTEQPALSPASRWGDYFLFSFPGRLTPFNYSSNLQLIGLSSSALKPFYEVKLQRPGELSSSSEGPLVHGSQSPKHSPPEHLPLTPRLRTGTNANFIKRRQRRSGPVLSLLA